MNLTRICSYKQNLETASQSDNMASPFPATHLCAEQIVLLLKEYADDSSLLVYSWPFPICIIIKQQHTLGWGFR